MVIKTRQPGRPHYIREWAELRGFAQQTDLAEEIGADKSVVSRWYSGATPGIEWQDVLVAALQLEDRESLFRHPDDDWMARFLRGRSDDEKQRIRQTLETAFPRKAS